MSCYNPAECCPAQRPWEDFIPMRYLPIIALVGLTLAAGPVLAQQGNSTSNGASGTTGDLNAPPSGSASDVNSSGTNSAPAPMAQEPAAEQPPMAQKPMAH